jgi:hypothetical protein
MMKSIESPLTTATAARDVCGATGLSPLVVAAKAVMLTIKMTAVTKSVSHMLRVIQVKAIITTMMEMPQCFRTYFVRLLSVEDIAIAHS